MASDCAPAARVTKAAAATMSERTLMDVFIVQVLGTQECFEGIRPPGRSRTTPKAYRVRRLEGSAPGRSADKLAFSAERSTLCDARHRPRGGASTAYGAT